MRNEYPEQRRNRIRAEMRKRVAVREAIHEMFRQYELRALYWPLTTGFGTVLDRQGDVVLFAYDGRWAPAFWVGCLEGTFVFNRNGVETGRAKLCSVDCSIRQCEFRGDLSGVLPGDVAFPRGAL